MIKFLFVFRLVIFLDMHIYFRNIMYNIIYIELKIKLNKLKCLIQNYINEYNDNILKSHAYI